MDLDNPFKTQPKSSSDAPAPSNSIRIEPFEVRSSSFNCSGMTESEVSQILVKELTELCGEQGFDIVSGNAQCVIRGEITKIDQGSRFLRAMIPFLGGEAKVEVHGEVLQGGRSSKPFDIKKTYSVGFWGGSSKGMIKSGLRHAAMKIASDAGLVGKQTAVISQSSGGALDFGPVNPWLYLGMMGVTAFIVAVIVGGYAHDWAMSMPERKDGIAMDDRGRWVLLQAALAFISILFGGLAAAPDSVLKSSALIWLRASAGVKSIIGQRILLGVLCFVPAILAYFSKKLM